MTTVTDITRREAAWLALSDERARWLARVLRARTDGYDAGHADGYRAGREAEAAHRDRLWNEAARHAARPGPSHDELEARRYGPAGRSRFGDPRPGDYAGREVTA